MFKTAVLSDAGFFDGEVPAFFNDVDLCGRLRKKGYKIFFTPDGRSSIPGQKPRYLLKYLENKRIHYWVVALF